MAIATAETESEVDSGEQHLVLYGIDWDQYVKINDAFPDRRNPRMIHVDRTLTILTLTGRRRWLANALDSIIGATALGCGINQEIGGSATYRLESSKVGLEGDRTYYFGVNAEIMRGPIDIDSTAQPPPDLAIEVEVSHPATKSIAAYAQLGVPEVWRYDARHATLSFLSLGRDGQYRPTGRSQNLVGLAPEDVLGQLRRAEEIGSGSRWFAQLPEWVRTTILPRMAEG